MKKDFDKIIEAIKYNEKQTKPTEISLNAGAGTIEIGNHGFMFKCEVNAKKDTIIHIVYVGTVKLTKYVDYVTFINFNGVIEQTVNEMIEEINK